MLEGITCYKAGVPKQTEEAAKKVNMLGLKVDEPTRAALNEICKVEDRPLGYVARELMLRGLAAYRRDGRMKEPQSAADETYPGDTILVPTIDLKKRQEKPQKRRA